MHKRIFSVILALACPQADLAQAAGDYPLSCKGWSGTVIERRGLNTTQSSMRGRVTLTDVQEYCYRDPGGETDKSGGRMTIRECVAKHLTTERKQELLTTADCQTGRITFRYGNRPAQTATFTLAADADNSCASPLSYLELQFQMLCPAKAAAADRSPTLTKGSDRIESGVCLELMIDGVSRVCDHTARIADNGAGTVDLISGFSDPSSPKSLIFDFATAQKANLENQYGYAFPVTSLRTMRADQPATRQEFPATGLCFMVKPNPIRAGSRNIKQDVVLMCTAQLRNSLAAFKRLDWKFAF